MRHIVGLLDIEMSREEFMDRLDLIEEQMWAIEQRFMDRNKHLTRTEKALTHLRAAYQRQGKKDREFYVLVLALIRAMCKQLGITSKYGLEDYVAKDDPDNPVTQAAWEIAKVMDWHDCPR